MRLSMLVAVSLLTTATLAPSPRAEACMDFEALSPTESSELLAAAEKALEAGQPRKVLELLAYSPEMAHWRHGNRRMELVAIANVRAGRVSAGLLSLRYLLRKTPDDPFLMARLAEGLGRTKNGRTEALAILERLEREDLMPDAQSYAVLAELLPAGPKAEAASARCAQLGAAPALCRARS